MTRRNIVLFFSAIQGIGMIAFLTISLSALPRLKIRDPERPVPVRILGKMIVAAGVIVPFSMLITTGGIIFGILRGKDHE